MPIEAAFAWPALHLSGERHQSLLRNMSQSGITGGAVSDALVAATALAADATLRSLDHRAARTYGLIGVDYRLIA